MAGLVAYESSDEEEDVVKISAPLPEPLPKPEATTADANSASSTKTQEAPPQQKVKPNSSDETTQEPAAAAATATAAVYGPQLGAAAAASSSSGQVNFPPLEGAEEAATSSSSNPTAVDVEEATSSSSLLLPPGSPYTSTRALLRDLTLPSIPDLSIPPSPPGSPSPSTGRKIEGFLDLKRKKGVHFNARLAENPAMRNPSLADKLLAFAELDLRDQYRTIAIDDGGGGSADGEGNGVFLWDPDAFPRHAYKEQLRQSQTDIAQARARNTGEPVKFVSAVTAAEGTAGSGGEDGGGSGSGGGSRSTTTLVTGTGKRKSRFDT